MLDTNKYAILWFKRGKAHTYYSYDPGSTASVKTFTRSEIDADEVDIVTDYGVLEQYADSGIAESVAVPLAIVVEWIGRHK